MTPQLMQAARHEAAHAVVGFLDGLQFRNDGIFVTEPSANNLELGIAAFVEPWNKPLAMIRVALAGPLYECSTHAGEVTEEAGLQLIVGSSYDSRNAALALALWLHQQDLTADIALRRIVFHSGTLSLRDWSQIEKHCESSDGQLLLEFHSHFISCLSCPTTEKPALPHGRNVSTLAVLQWLASETREQLLTHKRTVEALATELLTDKRLQGKRYAMSGPELESFLRIAFDT